MKKRISLILAVVMIASAICTAIPFFAFAAEEGDADFKVTDAQGVSSYHNAAEFTSGNTNPTLVAAGRAAGKVKVEMLRNVTHIYNFWLFGDVDFDGGNYTYNYTSSSNEKGKADDYAFCVANSPTQTGYGANIAVGDMKTVKFTNLTLRAQNTGKYTAEGATTPTEMSAGGFKFYNSILELGEGNDMKCENLIVLTPRDSGKIIVSGGTYGALDKTALFDIGGDRTN